MLLYHNNTHHSKSYKFLLHEDLYQIDKKENIFQNKNIILKEVNNKNGKTHN